MQSSESKENKPTRRELLIEWQKLKQNNKEESLKKSRSFSSKPMKFEDILRNDDISLSKAMTSQPINAQRTFGESIQNVPHAMSSSQRRAPSLTKGSSKENLVIVNQRIVETTKISYVEPEKNYKAAESAGEFVLDNLIEELESDVAQVIKIVDQNEDEKPMQQDDNEGLDKVEDIKKNPQNESIEHDEVKKTEGVMEAVPEVKEPSFTVNQNQAIEEEQPKTSPIKETAQLNENKLDSVCGSPDLDRIREKEVERKEFEEMMTEVKGENKSQELFDKNEENNEQANNDVKAPQEMIDETKKVSEIENPKTEEKIEEEIKQQPKELSSEEKKLEEKIEQENASSENKKGSKGALRKRKNSQIVPDENDEKVQSSLKKFHLNEEQGVRTRSSSTKKVKIDLNSVEKDNKEEDEEGNAKSSQKKKVIHNKVERVSELKNFGSGMEYRVIEVKRKSGVERVVTPIRVSKRISNINKSKSPSQKKLSKRKSNSNTSNTCSKLSVTFIEDSSEIHYLHNDVEDIFKPNDDETVKIREMIKKRRPTPYSKSTKKTEDSDEEERENRLLNEGFEDYGDDCSKSFSQMSESKIQIEKILDPNIRGNGNYALVEVKNSSAKKLGAKRAITPLKDITSDKINEAKEDVRFVSEKNEEEIAYVPRTTEIAKKLESFF